MSEAVSRKDIDEVIGLLSQFMQRVGDEFAKVNSRLGMRDQKLNIQDQKYDHLITTLDGFVARIDRYETELAMRDSQFEKLLAWPRKVSEKTGIPLENL